MEQPPWNMWETSCDIYDQAFIEVTGLFSGAYNVIVFFLCNGF